jgi:periplasmic divalent cation tolerance protein
MFIVLTTTPSFDEAETLAEKIVIEELAACVQILPGVTSIYVWEGKLHKDPEHLLLIKTLAEKFDELNEFIIANHSYDVPEIVAVDADKVSAPYLEWMKGVMRVKTQ